MARADRDERAWVRGAQRGSASDLEALFHAHWPTAHRAAYLVVHDAALAEDVAQEAFLAAVRNLDRFDRRRPFGPWLHRIVVNRAIDAASHEFFGAPAMYMGEGGSIPFMGMLGEKFPGAQFMITGVLGPHSNAHGPNEFLHIPMGKKVTASVARVLAEHHAASVRGETTGAAVVASTQERGDHGCC